MNKNAEAKLTIIQLLGRLNRYSHANTLIEQVEQFCQMFPDHISQLAAYPSKFVPIDEGSEIELPAIDVQNRAGKCFLYASKDKIENPNRQLFVGFAHRGFEDDEYICDWFCHAWTVDKLRSVIEPTPLSRHTYVGIELNEEKAMELYVKMIKETKNG